MVKKIWFSSIWRKAFFALLLCFAVSLPLTAAFLRNIPVKVVQPNGEPLSLFATGDEFYNWLHDANGYTIIQDPETGYYVYAVLENGRLASSAFPLSSLSAVNNASVSYLNIPKYLIQPWDKRAKPQDIRPGGSPATPEKILRAPRTGTLNNIAIFIRFSDESEFTDLLSLYGDMFNNSASGANSMLNYYREVSYNQLTIATSFYPNATTTVVSYQDSRPRSYYQPYNATTNPNGYTSSNMTDREHTLLKNAVDAVGSQIPAGLNIDGDGDGNVDNVCFIVYGSSGGWAELLWPHQWSLYTKTAYINGKRVWTYNFQLQTFLTASGVGVLCHEMFHSLGAPDLYHYNYDGLTPVSSWDLMEDDQNPPQHMGAYMKFKYGQWIASIPQITLAGNYSLTDLISAANNCYKIASPNSTTEYFVVEHRYKRGTFENSLPGSGLLIYRINPSVMGNANGPPDEVYVYRPNGTQTVNGSPSLANFGSHVGRTAINDATNPSSFLTAGGPGGLNISNIGSPSGAPEISDIVYAPSSESFYVSLTPVITVPTVTTTAVTNILATSAESGGNVTSSGGPAVTARGVCWSTALNPTTADAKTVDGLGTGSYTSAITGLSPSTTYQVRAYATNSAGTAYGSNLSFTTPSIISLPTVSTMAVTNISGSFAQSGGTVASEGGTAVTARGVCWRTALNPTTADSKTVDGLGMGSYTSAIAGLSMSTTYHVRAYATNSAGTAYGSDLSFITSSSSSIPFNENFLGATIPAGWNQQNIGTGITNRWSISLTSLAGGSPNEMRCDWQSVNPGTSRLVTPPLNTTGYAVLYLSFKHFLDSYDPGGLVLKVQTSPDGTTWTDESWSVLTSTANIGPKTESAVLTHNLNSSATYVAFVITGDLYNFDAWYIDDVSIAIQNTFNSAGSWTGAGRGSDGWYVGDFNGDGRSDIMRYNPGVSGAEIFLSNGSSFVDAGSWTGAGNGADGWHLGDFNGDGRTDIFRYRPGVSGAEVFLSDGTKFVEAGSWTGAGCGSDGWYVGDFNGDGRSDIMRYNPGVSGAEIFLSNGSSFVDAGSWTGAGNGADGWHLGDFNGDGRTDIFRYRPGVSGAEVFLSDGTKFVEAGSWTGAGCGSDGWYVGDFNGDGKDDIMRYTPGVGSEVFLSDGTQFVSAGVWTGAGNGTDGWYVGDFNGDGKDDIFRYLPGVSGADVFLSNSAAVGPHLSVLAPRLSALDEEMISEKNVRREMTYQEEEVFLSSFLMRQLRGEEVSIFEIKKAYEDTLGRNIRKAVIHQLLFRHGFWKFFERANRLNEVIK
jgi:M6 family metalloprotease-like protein